MEVTMKKINENYYLDSDSLNYILMEKKTYEKGKHIGEEYFENIGFYGTISGLYQSLVEKEIKDDLGMIENIKQVKELIESIKES
jgi:hypothetical protein